MSIGELGTVRETRFHFYKYNKRRVSRIWKPSELPWARPIKPSQRGLKNLRRLPFAGLLRGLPIFSPAERESYFLGRAVTPEWTPTPPPLPRTPVSQFSLISEFNDLLAAPGEEARGEGEERHYQIKAAVPPPPPSPPLSWSRLWRRGERPVSARTRSGDVFVCMYVCTVHKYSSSPRSTGRGGGGTYIRKTILCIIFELSMRNLGAGPGSAAPGLQGHPGSSPLQHCTVNSFTSPPCLPGAILTSDCSQRDVKRVQLFVVVISTVVVIVISTAPPLPQQMVKYERMQKARG